MRYLLVLLVLTILGAGCTDPPTPPNTLTQETVNLNSASTTQLSGTGSFYDLTQAVTTAFSFTTPYSGTYPVYTNDTLQISMSVTAQISSGVTSTAACPCSFTYQVGPVSGPAKTDASGAYLSSQIKF